MASYLSIQNTNKGSLDAMRESAWILNRSVGGARQWKNFFKISLPGENDG